MTGSSSTENRLQAVLETLADPDCREILTELEDARSAKAVAERSDIPQTSVYRKLEALSNADIVREGTEVRPDGHHIKTYERDISGVLVLLEDDAEFEFEFVQGSSSPDQRLAKFWSRISEEL